MCVLGCMVCMWRSGDNCVVIILPFHLYVGSSDGLGSPGCIANAFTHWALSMSWIWCFILLFIFKTSLFSTLLDPSGQMWNKNQSFQLFNGQIAWMVELRLTRKEMATKHPEQLLYTLNTNTPGHWEKNNVDKTWQRIESEILSLHQSTYVLSAQCLGKSSLKKKRVAKVLNPFIRKV